MAKEFRRANSFPASGFAHGCFLALSLFVLAFLAFEGIWQEIAATLRIPDVVMLFLLGTFGFLYVSGIASVWGPYFRIQKGLAPFPGKAEVRSWHLPIFKTWKFTNPVCAGISSAFLFFGGVAIALWDDHDYMAFLSLALAPLPLGSYLLARRKLQEIWARGGSDGSNHCRERQG